MSNHLPGAYVKARRQQELDADRFAVSAMAAAGYNPHELLNYIRRVQPPRAVNESLSPPPPLSLRAADLEVAIQSLPDFGAQASDESFRSIQERVRNELTHFATPSEAPSLLYFKR